MRRLHIKKFLSILFVFSLLFMLTACSSSTDPSQESSRQTTSPSSQQDSVSVSNEVLESERTESEQSANNTLIVYFSRWGNTEYLSDVDATTSASIVVENDLRYGTTEYVANMIAEKVGGHLHRIETVTPYTADCKFRVQSSTCTGNEPHSHGDLAPPSRVRGPR